MLPEDRELTPQEIAQVARDAKAYMREHAVSLASLSRQLGQGYSQATLSNFLNGHKRGDQERVARALNAWLETQTRAAEVARPEGFVETDVARKILTVIRTAVDSRKIGVVTGSAGMGKTLTAKAAHKMFPGSIYLRVTQSERRNTGLVASLARILNIPIRSTISHSHRLVIEHLSGTNRPLLIDEAHKLHEGALDALRDIHDEAGVPLVLFGTIKLTQHVNDTEVFFGQFSSRIVARVDLTELATKPRRGGKARPLFSVDEILAIFASSKLRLTDDAARLLAQLACLPGLGSLRLCSMVMDIAARMPALRSRAVDAKDIRAIVRQMHSDAFVKLADVRTEQLQVETTEARTA